MYYPRLIDNYLKEWALRPTRKPLLLRGARQVGKSTAVRQLGKQFENFVEINLEKQPSFISLFQGDLDVKRIVPQLSAMVGKPIVAGQTLLFIDEIQTSAEAIMALRFFKEDMPDLHVIAAGSLLEFALETLPTFGVGRIHSMFVYPMTFDEFLRACGETLLLEARNSATAEAPLPLPLYEKLVGLFRSYMLVGGMPEVVAKWVATRDYLACQEVQDDIVLTYQDDFPKYRKRVDPTLLRLTLQSVALQIGRKFVYSQVGGGYSAHEVKKALEMLILAGIITPVTQTNANGLPLGSEADPTYRKMLLLDSGLLLRWLDMTGDISALTALTEMIAGLELLRYRTPNMRHELFYWMRKAKNAQAEVDYLVPYQSAVLPIEVKAGTQGGMKSLWLFMREKKLKNAVRASLENFGVFTYTDTEDKAERTVRVCPLFALSQMGQ